MQRSQFIVVVGLAILTAAPPAVAWMGAGQSEPSTQHDISDGWMFQTPDTSPDQNVMKVYFNGFPGESNAATGGTGAADPTNTGLIPTSNTPRSYSLFAMLGVWKDCNKDGYVGDGEEGLFEYRSTLLLDTSVCPPNSNIPDPIPLGWVPPHNDGQWVHELIPIQWNAPVSSTTDLDKFNLNDNGARVWYDNFAPDAGSSRISCWINPPTGSLHSTGGILFYGDCNTNYRVTPTFDSLADQNAVTKPYSFSDVDSNPQTQNKYYASSSKANVENPWGDQSEGSYAQTWDCSKAPAVQETTPSESVPGVITVNPVNVNVSQPKVPPTVDTTHLPTVNGARLYDLNGDSAAGTVNATANGVDQCNRRTDVTGGGRAGGLASEPYAEEAPVSQSTATSNSKGVLVGFDDVSRPGYCPLVNTTTGGCATECTPDTPAGAGSCTPVNAGQAYEGVLGRGTPRDLGDKHASSGGFWYDAASSWTNKDGGTQRLQFTFYAYISPSAIAQYGLCLPKDAPTCGGGPTLGTYGQEFCQGTTIGVVNGWDCDRTHWWLNALGQDDSQRSPALGRDPSADPNAACTVSVTATSTAQTTRGCMQISPYVGDSYDMRDVDCFDNLVQPARSLPVFPVTVLPGTVDVHACGGS